MRGCKPDVGAHRPIVVRASKDSGKTWGNITIAGPALPNVGTNYPGAFLRDNGTTVVLRYLYTTLFRSDASCEVLHRNKADAGTLPLHTFVFRNRREGRTVGEEVP